MRIKTQNTQSMVLLCFFTVLFDFVNARCAFVREKCRSRLFVIDNLLKQFSIFEEQFQWPSLPPAPFFFWNIFTHWKQERECGAEIRLDDDWNGLIYISCMHTLHTWSLHSAGSSGQKSTICMRWTHLYANSLACTDLLHFFHSGLFTY